MVFADRADAGAHLAAKLQHLRDRPVVVLGLPRGGVPVAAEVAHALGAPLDVIVVRKLGVPSQPELGMGAIGEDGVRVVNADVLSAAGVSAADLAAVEARERAELERRAWCYRGGGPRQPLTGRIAVVIDDGLATGSTARAACQIARAQGAAAVVLAVPVAPLGWESRLAGDADELVSVQTPEDFFAIGQFYADFSQTSDEEVIDCLQRAGPAPSAVTAPAAGETRPAMAPEAAARAPETPARAPETPAHGLAAELSAGTAGLPGQLTVPDQPLGIVAFAHGSGSTRRSPRNRYVAEVMNQAGLGSLLFDLLTPEEELDRANVFDIGLLAGRLADVASWLRTLPETAGLPTGYFGASTGAAAALWAAAEPGADVAAVVSRGGRPDLAGPRLGYVRAPTLLIVGELDDMVLDLNRQAQAQLCCENSLAVIPGATHLFEEPGTLAAAAELARDWFTAHLITSATGRSS